MDILDYFKKEDLADIRLSLARMILGYKYRSDEYNKYCDLIKKINNLEYSQESDNLEHFLKDS